MKWILILWAGGGFAVIPGFDSENSCEIARATHMRVVESTFGLQVREPSGWFESRNMQSVAYCIKQ